MSGQTVTKGNVNLRDDTVALVQRQYVWDPIGLRWVPEQQASGGAASTVNQGTAGTAASAWYVSVTEDATHTKVEPGDATNKALRVNVVAGGAGDGSILDGVTSTTKATVAHYTNRNPLAVSLRDTNGDYIAAGAGTQYTQNVASTTNPIGTAEIIVRRDLPTTTGRSDGAYQVLQGNKYGAAYHALVRTTGALLGTGGTGNRDTSVLRVVLATDQPALTNKLLVTPDALPANQRVNVAQMNGTTVTMNAGNGGVGTQRVYLATDQPALTNKLLVTPDSVALPANQSVNVSQMNGTTVRMNSGNGGVGTQRVYLATDQPALTNKLLVTPDRVALPANQSVNVAQMGGTTTSMNSGNTDVGTPRVVVATNTPANALWGQGATAAAVPANAEQVGYAGATALPTAVTNGQLVGGMADKFGRHVAVLGTIRDLRATQRTTIRNTTAETTIVTAGAAGVFNDLIMIIANNSRATAVRVDIRDTTGGTIITDLYCPAGQPVGFAVPGSSIPQGRSAGNWTAQCSVAVTDMRITAIFEKNK